MNEKEAIEKLKVLLSFNGFLSRETGDKAINIAIKALEEIQQYRALGTVEELREAKEKQTPKKPIQPFGTHSYKCPSCYLFVAHEVDDNCDLENEMADWCPYCGQKLDWSK